MYYAGMSEIAPQESAGYLASQMARLFALQLSAALEPLGLATAQFAVLMHLWQGKAMTQKELAVCIGVEQATMANTLARMRRDGLTEHQPHPADRRAQIIRPTPQALALREQAMAAAEGVNRQMLAGLRATEQAEFVRLLSKVIAGQLAWRAEG